MRLALELSSSLGVELPTTQACDDVYRSVLEKRGDEDFSAIYTANEHQSAKKHKHND
jgi:3-hydroxyisobutyrate dehydrogenase-like beta-hydroxyacid dehydrogenase